MQTCPDCGARNEDGELFCGACGTYLEWEEQRSASASSSASSSTTAELTEEKDVTSPVVEQVAEPMPATAAPTRTAAHAPAEATAPPKVSPAVKQGPDRRAQTSTPTAATPEETSPAEPAEEKQAATAPTPAPAPVRPSATGPKPVKPAAVPAPVKPAAATPRRYVPPTAKDEPPPAPGDLICGACGAGNAPHRNFCRRCGASLADAPTQGRSGWWRRWRARRRARKEGPKAGTRPKRRRRRRFPTKTVVLLVVLGLLAGAGWHYQDDVRTGYNTVLDRVAGDKPVNPSKVSASSSAAHHGARLARDGISDRYWAPEATGDGAGEWLQFEFAKPFRLVTVLLTSGASTEDETRLQQARPSKVRFTVTTADGSEHIQDVAITDTGSPQALSVPFSDVVSVRMTILSAYGATGNHRVAVAEVEFRGR